MKSHNFYFFLKTKNTKPLELKESSQNGVYVKNLSCFVVNNEAELERLKEIGMS